ncbi:transmembrane protein 183 [Macrosteles quadrilineatus]|uniref:transmembrane protein 183 n=1 Tax=Macrosteles quadrilineatus TaxID=74068 RepID=UPI0023E1CD6A|nr:transmembrane protein 183 [Macrosteles quadrilineatus]
MSGQNRRKGLKSGSSKKAHGTSLGDVTLADFANATVASGRLRKAKAAFDVVREVKHLNIEDKAWDEKLEEFDGDFDFVKEENEDGEEVMVMKRSSRRKKTLSESLADKASGNVYSLDIWHLISEYIRPEDVAKFSAICRNSWSVVNTATFWFKLYRRFYKKVPNLPVRLQPECMVRHYGLKACVVRSLFYMYPPLASRVDGPSMGTPYDLKNRQCISLWQERQSTKWLLSFKLRRKDCQPNTSKQDLLEILGDIFANPDEGCTILQVVATERMPILPAVMGLTLHSINMSLDMTMAHMHVQLMFGSGRVCNGKLDPSGTVAISIKTVTQVCVLDWWHPRYPHSSSIIRRGDDS